MRTQRSHKLVFGLMAALTLLEGCTTEQLKHARQEFKNVSTVAETVKEAAQTVSAVADATGEVIKTVDKGSKMAACLEDKAPSNTQQGPQENTVAAN